MTHVKLAVLSDEVAADTQTLVYNQDTNRWDPAVPDSGTSVTLGKPIDTAANLPATGTDGEGRIAQDTGHLWQWDGTAWVDMGTVQGPAGSDATVTDTNVAAVIDSPTVIDVLNPVIDSRTGTGQRPIGRDEERIDVRHYGAVGDGATDDTAAIKSATTAAITTGQLLFFPAGTYLVDALAVNVSGVAGFSLDMVGRMKRKNGSSGGDIVRFTDCTDLRIGTVRTDGNVTNNGSGGHLVDQSKSDVALRGCRNVHIDVIDSVNTACDALLIQSGTGRTQDVHIGRVSSRSDGFTGRNGFTIIEGDRIDVGSILSINTGCNTPSVPMPGGVDIEPWPADTATVTDVTIGTVVVHTAGNRGLAVDSHASTGDRNISNVTIGSVTVHKKAGTKTESVGVLIQGTGSVTVREALVDLGGGDTGGVWLANVDGLTMRVDVRNTINTRAAVVVGSQPTGPVENFDMHVAARNVSSGIELGLCNEGVIDVHLEDVKSIGIQQASSGIRVSNAVTLRGKIKHTTSTTWALYPAHTTGWVLDGIDLATWPEIRRLGTPTAAGTVVKRGAVPGLTSPRSAPPTTNYYAQGERIDNASPTAGQPQGWVCTASGAPGTWVALPNL